VNPEVSGLAAWSKDCKWYSSLPLGAVVLAILWVILVSFAAITLCVASQEVFVVVGIYFVMDSVRKLLNTHCTIRECIQKFPDWPFEWRTANVTALYDYVQLYRYFVSQSSEFCRHIPLCCFTTSAYCCLFRYRLSPESFRYTLVLSSVSLWSDWGEPLQTIVTITGLRARIRDRHAHENTGTYVEYSVEENKEKQEKWPSVRDLLVCLNGRFTAEL
jgi:hypothetical protein